MNLPLAPLDRGNPLNPFNDACRLVVRRVDGAVACGVVDLESGRLLGLHHAPQAVDMLSADVAAAVRTLFRGPNIGRVEQCVRSLANPAVGGQRFQEAHVTSAHGRHFAKTLRGGQVAVIVVTRHSTNLGLGWAQLKAAIPEVESLMS